MKNFLIAAAALSLGGAAIAQSTTQPTPPATGTTPTQGDSMVDPATNAPVDQPMSQQQPMNDTSSQPMSQQPTMDPSMQPAPQQPMADPSTQPMSQGQTGSMSTGNMQGMAMSSPPTGEYPRCSRTVTDRCTQVAGNSRPRRRR